jgi:hypothetical protein
MNHRPTNYQLVFLTKDAKLMMAIRDAVYKKPTPRQIERIVRSEALINTTKQFHWKLLRLANIDTDDEFNNNIPSLRKMKHVVCWMRPTPTPKIIGVCWDKNNKIVIFYGVVIGR